MRPATVADLAWVATAALQAHVVGSAEELVALNAAEPWRARVSGRGEAAILDRWREGSPDCAILGLWCAPRRVAELLAELEDHAAALGFERLLSPLIPEEAAASYLAAGMSVVERVVLMRLDLRGSERARLRAGAHPLPEGIRLRDANGAADLRELVALDARCFDEFWSYDHRLLERLSRTGHLIVAEEGGSPIGYTLATIHGADGSLGRLAVLPKHRGRGVGRALADAGLAWLAGRGARTAVLSTQEHNAPSQALYRSLGFVRLPGNMVACASGVLGRS